MAQLTAVAKKFRSRLKEEINTISTGMKNITPHGLAKISRDLGVPMEEAEAYMILARHAVPAASSKMPFDSVAVEVSFLWPEFLRCFIGRAAADGPNKKWTYQHELSPPPTSHAPARIRCIRIPRMFAR